jgi:hypothetical protein
MRDISLFPAIHMQEYSPDRKIPLAQDTRFFMPTGFYI